MDGNLRLVFVGPCDNENIRMEVEHTAQKVGFEIEFVNSVFDADILVLSPGWKYHPMTRSLIDAMIHLNLGNWAWSDSGKIEINEKDRGKPLTYRLLYGREAKDMVIDEFYKGRNKQ